LFMAGLGLGAWVGTVLLKRGAGARALLWGDLVWVGFMLAMLPLTYAMDRMDGAWLEALLLILALVAGALTAMPFPWVSSLLLLTRGSVAEASEIAQAGGIADATDHAGAIFGALLTGTFLIPLLGFSGSLLLLGGVKALSALGGLLPGGAGLGQCSWRGVG
ncbi:MAG: hypothetical protein KAY24_13300, partial [Candidatus Eisenbacteria sp.]|nr:hypothetical protein [Candidatus Eisenbacteria bacterium]